MFKSFFFYFFRYLVFAKTRQRLLFLAFTGLFLSSFSLISIQGIMGGLQKGLIQRSKTFHGLGYFKVDSEDLDQINELTNLLKNENVQFTKEWEVELLLKNEDYLAPVILHGIDYKQLKPDFLESKDVSGIVLGTDLSYKLKNRFYGTVQVFSPATPTSLLGEIPKFSMIEISDLILSDVQDIDQFHAWVRIEFLQNLRRQINFNRFRIFKAPNDQLSDHILNHPQFVSWEKQHATLVWSLNLETKVMFLLFLSMSFLVALAISAGLLLFMEKIRKDLASFWILGGEESQLSRMTLLFTCFLSFVSSSLGVVFGSIFLLILEQKGHDIMPEIFVERNLPVALSFSSIVISISIPFLIALVFTLLTFRNFQKDQVSFLSLIRRTN